MTSVFHLQAGRHASQNHVNISRPRRMRARVGVSTMKKSLSFVMPLLVGAALVAGCGKPEPAAEAAPPEPPRPLVLATDACFPPYEYFAADGSVAGIDIDICRAIADKLGRPLEIVVTNFAAVLLAVQVGTADIGASAITIIEERKMHLDFSIPYVTSGTVIVSRKGEEYKDAASAKGRRIGVQAGTTSDNYCTEELGVKPERYYSTDDASAALKAGKVDLIILDADPARNIVKADDSLVISSDFLTMEEYGVAVGKGNQELLSSVNAVIDQLVKDRQIEVFAAAHAKSGAAEAR